MPRWAWLVMVGGFGCQALSMPAHHPTTAAGATLLVVEAGENHPGPPSLPPQAEPALAASAPRQEVAASPAVDHMKQAVLSLERGDEAGAAAHLELYVAERPEHLIARAQLAELLFRQNRMDDSRLHFELFIAQAQEYGEEAFRYLVQCHSRLVEIAEVQEDAYQEHLNRGIGLYLLARRRATEPDPDGEPSARSLYCRAAAELQEARLEQPEDARPALYLYQSWSALGQRSAAKRALRDADAHALFTRLTPCERRQLQIACIHEADPHR